jgi:hypothetical protein
MIIMVLMATRGATANNASVTCLDQVGERSAPGCVPVSQAREEDFTAAVQRDVPRRDEAVRNGPDEADEELDGVRQLPPDALAEPDRVGRDEAGLPGDVADVVKGQVLAQQRPEPAVLELAGHLGGGELDEDGLDGDGDEDDPPEGHEGKGLLPDPGHERVHRGGRPEAFKGRREVERHGCETSWES